MHTARAHAVDQGSKLKEALNLLWQERYGYPFDTWVADRRDRDASWRGIARELEDLTSIAVSNVTLLKWYGDRERTPAGDAA